MRRHVCGGSVIPAPPATSRVHCSASSGRLSTPRMGTGQVNLRGLPSRARMSSGDDKGNALDMTNTAALPAFSRMGGNVAGSRKCVTGRSLRRAVVPASPLIDPLPALALPQFKSPLEVAAVDQDVRARAPCGTRVEELIAVQFFGFPRGYARSHRGRYALRPVVKTESRDEQSFARKEPCRPMPRPARQVYVRPHRVANHTFQKTSDRRHPARCPARFAAPSKNSSYRSSAVT